MTPIDISPGATAILARRSARTMMIAPVNAQAGAERRKIPPCSLLARWGTTSPMNPIVPVRATRKAMMREMRRKTRKR